MTRTFGFVAAIALTAPFAAGAADVGISLQFSQPGVYGRIDLGQYPQPQVVMAQPILVAPPPPAAPAPEPVYLWVPPGHRKHWDRHCQEYRACGQPVYFVDDNWYQRNVMAHEEHEHGHGHGHGHEHGHGHGHDHDD